MHTNMTVKLAADSNWLVYSGNDGWHSTVARGLDELRRAWLDHHFSQVDHSNLDEQHLTCASILDDDDAWDRSHDGEPVSLCMNYEGDHVGVIRIDELDVAPEIHKVIDKLGARVTALEADHPDTADAERFRALIKLGACNSKKAGLTIGDAMKSKLSFMFWCTPDEVRPLIDQALTTYKEANHG